jgi:hypothetical protein
MIQFCKIVLTLVSCTMDPQAPKPSPAEAAAVLQRATPPAAPAWRLEELDAYDNRWGSAPEPSYDRLWPFTTTTPPTFSPQLYRLDGSSVFQPPYVYGGNPYGHSYGGYGSHSESASIRRYGGYDRATNTYYPDRSGIHVVHRSISPGAGQPARGNAAPPARTVDGSSAPGPRQADGPVTRGAGAGVPVYATGGGLRPVPPGPVRQPAGRRRD